MVSNHAKTIQNLGVLGAGGIQCNHFQVVGYRSLNHCLLHGFTFKSTSERLCFPVGLWPFTCTKVVYLFKCRQ